MKKLLLITGTLLLLAVSAATAAEFSEGERYTSIKAGLIGSGTVDVEGTEINQSTGFSLGLSYDFPLGERLHYGISVDLHRMKWSGDADRFQGEDAETLLDLGLVWKYMLVLSEDQFAIRPGIGAGYGTLRRRQTLNGTNYLTLKAFTEIIYFSARGTGLLVEVGGFYAPTGGDSDTDIKIGPLLYARVGLMF
jgi:outer membrane protein with beta-barrel domain